VSEFAVLPETQTHTSLGDRRGAARYLCRIKARYIQDDRDKVARSEERWHTAQAIDISTSGIALLLQRHLIPGTELSITPVIPSWKHGWVLHVKVVTLRPGAGYSWCAGCEFVRPLTDGQLRVFLHNSE
jgi:hypothetical protein